MADPEYVRRVGKSTIVSLLDITTSYSSVFQLQTGRVADASGGTAYEPQTLVVSGSVLLAIYEMIEPYVDRLRQERADTQSAK